MGLARTAEADQPPVDGFVTVDGMRLHYFERGTGTPVVLLHGNGSMIGDFVSSGITERVACDHRVIAFDRPGFGYSERPRGRTWGPSEQARLLLRAFALLGIERPIVVGHSWGTLVALALALEDPEQVAGLVLLSGYYYPVPRARANALAPSAFPIVDDVLRHTVVPLVGRLMASGAVRRVFAPCAVPERFKRHYSIPHALRPSQIKAVAEEAAMLVESARTFSELYKELSVPVRLIAGSDDRIVETDKHSARLHRELGTSTFRNVPGIGHMVHHAAPEEVIAAIAAVGEIRQAGAATKSSASRRQPVRRHWLHIGDSCEERERPTAVGTTLRGLFHVEPDPGAARQVCLAPIH
jgi:pimeloyl-ACP methyl ester carboxylesterase